MNRLGIGVVLAGLCGSLAGCLFGPALDEKPAAEAPAAPVEAAQPPKAVAVKDDEFDKTIVFSSPDAAHEPELNSRKPNIFRLKSSMDRKSHEVKHQLAITHNYSNKTWKFWQRAADEDANPLELVSITRDVGFCRPACSYTEIVGVILDDGVLRAKKDKGYRIKLYARDGSEKIIPLTVEQITMQLDAIDQRKPPEPAPIPVASVESKPKAGGAKLR